MPQRRDRTPVFVRTPFQPGPTSTLLAYGFNSGADSAAQSVLGQQSVASGAVGGVIVWGVNRPKPVRVSKMSPTGTESSYCGHTELAAAKGAGWRVSVPAKYAGPRKGLKTVGVYVDTAGGGDGEKIKYAWMMDKGDLAAFGSDLGIAQVTGNDNVVYGCSHPRPANVAKIVPGSGDSGSRSTGGFVADAKFDDLPAGWNLRSAARRARY